MIVADIAINAAIMLAQKAPITDQCTSLGIILFPHASEICVTVNTHQLLYSYGIFAVEYIGFPIVGGKLSEVSRRATEL